MHNRRNLPLYARIIQKVAGGALFFFLSLSVFISTRYTSPYVIQLHNASFRFVYFRRTSVSYRTLFSAKLLIYKLSYSVCVAVYAVVRSLDFRFQRKRICHINSIFFKRKKRYVDDAEHMQNIVQHHFLLIKIIRSYVKRTI